MGLYFNITAILLAIIMLAYNFRHNKSGAYLGISLFFLNLNVIISHFIMENHSIFGMAILFNNFVPTSFLPGPFLYFFVRGTLTGKDTIQRRDGWFFLPFLIAVVGVFPYWFTPFSHKLQMAQSIIQNPLLIPSLPVNWLYPFAFTIFSRTLLFFICISLCFHTIWRFYPSPKKAQRIGQLKFISTFRWVLFFTILLFVLTISQFTGLYYFLNSVNSTEMLVKVKKIWLFSDIGFLLISLFMLFFPQLLYGSGANFSRKGNQFSHAEIEKFHQVFYEEHFFLNPAANLEGLAIALNFDKEDIISFVAKQEAVSFPDFLQKSRVNYLVELLKIKDNQLFTFDALAEMAGLGTRQAMYLAFKKVKNCSPTEFIHSISS
jgi:AraC-like DNA-binding protein